MRRKSSQKPISAEWRMPVVTYVQHLIPSNAIVCDVSVGLLVFARIVLMFLWFPAFAGMTATPSSRACPGTYSKRQRFQHNPCRMFLKIPDMRFAIPGRRMKVSHCDAETPPPRHPGLAPGTTRKGRDINTTHALVEATGMLKICMEQNLFMCTCTFLVAKLVCSAQL